MKHLITSLPPAFSSWRMRPASLALIGAVALLCLAAASGPPAERGINRLQKLAGAWSVNLSVESAPGIFPKLMTFTSDGIVLGDEASIPFESTAHGNWVATGPWEAAYTFFALVGGGPDGGLTMTIKVVGKLQYDARGDTWSGPIKVWLFDADGNEIFSDRGTFTATRIAVETLD